MPAHSNVARRRSPRGVAAETASPDTGKERWNVPLRVASTVVCGWLAKKAAWIERAAIRRGWPLGRGKKRIKPAIVRHSSDNLA